MRHWLVGLALLISPAAYAQPVPEIPYKSVPNLLKLPPDMHLGEVAGVAVNSRGHIFVYSRGGSSQGPAFANTASQILEFDRNGVFIRQPTDVTWDPEGNIYISDGYVNSRIAKYDANGDWVKSWGQRGKGPGEFNLVHTMPPMRRATSTRATAITGASRFSTATAPFSARSRSTSRSKPMPGRRSATGRT